jgi:MFS family permease
VTQTLEPAAAVAPAEAAGARRLLTPAFLLLSTAQTATYAAEFFGYVAMSWLTIQLTHSGLAVGAVLASGAIPRAVLMLVGGAISDRFSPFAAMIVTAAGRAVLAGGLAALVLAGRVQVWELFAFAALLGVLGAFFMPARGSTLPAVVEEPLLEPANAAIFVASQVAAVAGPALAGLVVARWGSGPAFAVDAAGFAIAAAACLPLRGLGGRIAGTQAPSALWAAIRAGLAFVWGDPMLRALLLAILALNFAAAGPFEVGATVLARVRWGGAWALGLEFGSLALGAMTGAAATGLVRRRLPLGWALIAISAAFAAGIPLIGLAPSVWPAAAVTCVLGTVNGYLYVMAMAWIQRRTPADLLGRVMSLMMVGSVGVGPVSYAIAGFLVAVDPELVFLLGGGICLAAAIASAASRTVRET